MLIGMKLCDRERTARECFHWLKLSVKKLNIYVAVIAARDSLKKNVVICWVFFLTDRIICCS